MGTPLLYEGETMYRIRKITKQDEYYIAEIKCISIQDYGHYVYKFDDGYTAFDRNIGTCIFHTKEEAEQMLKNKNLLKIKKEKLKQYEQKLNEELGITSIIIK